MSGSDRLRKGEAYSSQIAKSISPPPPPPPSPTVMKTDKPALTCAEHYFSTPAGLFQLSLLEPTLQQRSADGRAHWEEKRERNMRAYPLLFNIGGAETCKTAVGRPRDMEELLTLKEFLEEEEEWEWVEAKMRDGARKVKVDNEWELVGKAEGDEAW